MDNIAQQEKIAITSHNKKSLQKSLYTQHKKIIITDEELQLTYTANKIITNLTQYDVSQEKTDLLKAGFYFSIQPDKIQKSKIFTNFEKIYQSFINNLKFKKPDEDPTLKCEASLQCFLNKLKQEDFFN